MACYIFIITFVIIIICFKCSTSDQAVYEFIKNKYTHLVFPLAPFSESVFYYTAGIPRYIPLWKMQKFKFRRCYDKGFPSKFDLSTSFPAGTEIDVLGNKIQSTKPMSNLGLLNFMITETNFSRNERLMPLYYFPRVVNLYRFFHGLRMRSSNIPFLKDYEETMFLYTYIVCTNVGAESVIDSICPNLCNYPDDICRVDNTVHKTCSLVGMGVMENQLRCSCRFELEWDINLKKCTLVRFRLCSLIEENKYCNSIQTKECNVYFDQIYPVCICKPGFHGDDCSLINSRCILPSIDGKWPPGYDSCRVLTGGKCLENNTTDYSCICPNEFTQDTHFPYPNCYKKIVADLCKNDYCENNAICKQISDIIAICKCLDGFVGFRCQFPLGTWTKWTEWSNCYPSCGPKRIKYKFRDCLGDTTCIGSMIATGNCGKLSCPTITWRKPLNLSSVLHSIFIQYKDYNPTVWMLKYSGVMFFIELTIILVVGAIFVGLGWLVFIAEQSFRGGRSLLNRFRNKLKPHTLNENK